MAAPHGIGDARIVAITFGQWSASHHLRCAECKRHGTAKVDESSR